SPPELWDALLESRMRELDPVAIRICWEASREHRSPSGDPMSALGLARLAHRLSTAFGSAYERAESTYELAMSYLNLREHEATVAQLERALDLYLEDLSYRQAAECVKWLGDVKLFHMQAPGEAATWYRAGLTA